MHKADLTTEIVKVLLYADIFSYPLREEEIIDRLSISDVSLVAIRSELTRLTERNSIFCFNDFYSVRNDQGLATRRLAGNRMAEELLPLALKKCEFIAKFPFVRAVYISGSLSKKYMDAESDFDFFVITAPGRLWIARMIHVMYKRLFLGNSRKHFCINYYISENNLHIEEQNIFTATELSTVIPVSGNHYQQLLESNRWLREYYPNFKPVERPMVEAASNRVQKFFEALINPLGNWLDQFCMRIFQSRAKRLYGKQLTSSDFAIAFKSRKDVSKGHPYNYQGKVTTIYQNRVEEFLSKNEM